MGEVVKVLLANSNDEETWSYEARDILLDTWTTLLAVSTAKFLIKKQLRISITLCMVVFMKLCGHIWFFWLTLSLSGYLLIPVIVSGNNLIFENLEKGYN